MKLIEYLVPVAHAQSGQAKSNFTLNDFNFLKILSSNNGEGAFNNLLGTVISLTLTIAAIVAFFYLIIAGFQYITAGGDAGKAQTARQGIVNALVGIVIIVIAYVLLRYVGTVFTGAR